MMTGEELDEILKSIEFRKPYVTKYYKTFKFRPQWIRGEGTLEDGTTPPDFEDWLKAEVRNEKIDSLLNILENE